MGSSLSQPDDVETPTKDTSAPPLQPPPQTQPQQQQPIMNEKELNNKFLAACRAGDLNLVKQLIKSGASPHDSICTRDSSRVSQYSHPVFEAISSGNSVLIRYLIETEKVDIFKARVRNVQDGRRHTRIHEYDALCHAIEASTDPVMLEYLVYIAKTRGMLDKPVANYSYSAEYRDTNEVVNEHFFEMTYLHYAAWRSCPKACELLLRYGWDLKKRTKSSRYSDENGGKTALDIYPELLDIIAKQEQITLQGSNMLQASKLFDIDILTL